MKKLIFTLLIVIALTALIAGPAFAYTISPKILVGQTTWVGNVKITPNADGSITLLWMLKGGLGYCMTEWAVHAADTMEEIPQNNGGAIPGQFEYQDNIPSGACVTTGSLIIWPSADDDWGFGDKVYLAIHIVVNGGPENMVGETGWVVRCGNLEGGQFPGNNWSAWLAINPDTWNPSW